jgi:murein DD-endopeptidase MepM/ murein hydrolase activator NlpD
MRRARKAAIQAMTAALLTATFTVSSTVVARAMDSNGGTSAPTASTVVNTAGSGGALAPSVQGTGGSEYEVVSRKPPARKRATRKPFHTRRRPRTTPKPKVAPPTPVTPVQTGSPAGMPTPAQTAGEGAVFPVVGSHSFGDGANRFGAGRVGHIHEGQDVLASEGTPVVAPLAGTILTTAYQAGGAGWYSAEHTVAGLDFFFAHCQAGSLAVSTGEAVHAGQAICKVGQTGDATGPHLHFEIWVGGWQAPGGQPIDPLPYLEAWDLAGGG